MGCNYCGRADCLTSGLACPARAYYQQINTQLGNTLAQRYLQAMPFGTVAVYSALAAAVQNSTPTKPLEPLPSAGMKVEDLIGWRIWRVKNGHLWSYSADYAWMPGEVSEGVPGDHDGAGIWAFKDKRRAFQKAVEHGYGYVWGSVLLWGHVVEHKDGYRASKARIVSIAGATRDVTREVLADLCEIHGVEVPTHVSRLAIADTPPPSEYGKLPPYILVPAPYEKPRFPWPLVNCLGVTLGMLGLFWAFY